MHHGMEDSTIHGSTTALLVGALWTVTDLQGRIERVTGDALGIIGSELPRWVIATSPSK
jgi:uncharacterized protein affecting Mg2+/Co2+ transport